VEQGRVTVRLTPGQGNKTGGGEIEKNGQDRKGTNLPKGREGAGEETAGKKRRKSQNQLKIRENKNEKLGGNKARKDKQRLKDPQKEWGAQRRRKKKNGIPRWKEFLKRPTGECFHNSFHCLFDRAKKKN